MNKKVNEKIKSSADFLKQMHSIQNCFDEMSEDELREFDNTLSDIAAYSLSLRKRVNKVATRKFRNSHWAWYYRSIFLNYYTSFTDDAYKCAKNSISIMRRNQEYIGCVSRNYIKLAFEHKDFGLINEEIERLYNNPYSKSKILEGVAIDLENKVNDRELSDISIKILAERLPLQGGN